MIRRTSDFTRIGMVWALVGAALGQQTVVIPGGTLIDGTGRNVAALEFRWEEL